MKSLLCAMTITAFTLPALAAQTSISCSAVDSNAKFELYPSIYINSDQNLLCFNVTDWMGYKGTNCVKDRAQAQWNAIVIMFDKNSESMGRNETDFRVSNVSITNEAIGYFLEWGRSGKWWPKQRIEINRLTGNGVSWFLTEHGGLPIKCTGNARKF